MAHRLSSAMVTGGMVLALSCGLAFGDQSTDQTKDKDTKSAGQTVTVTGCLKQETGKTDFLITGEDGKTYTLKSSGVKLEDHLNHKVTVSGKTKKGAHDQAGDLNVNKLTMVSQSCP